MFYIITGKPGASKTLHAIALVEEMRAQARKDRSVERPVYYWNIGDVTVEGWYPLGDASTFDLANEGVQPDASQALKWYELPRDAIIVLDECQKLFPKRPQGAKVPPHVEHLETHRKSGFDIVGISQDPTLIDSHVRKLCGMHTHYRRIFGTESYHSWTWQEKCVTDVESTTEQGKAQESRGRFPKKYYGTYRSAQVHNVKARPPWKWIITIAALLVIVPGLVWVAVSVMRSYTVTEPENPALTQEQLAGALARERQATVHEVVTHVKALLDANPWDERLHKERVAGLDASRPFFDELVRPVAFPKIAGCAKLIVNGTVQCWCNSQQGTKLELPTRQCLRYVQAGWFDFTRPDVEESSGSVGGDSGPGSTFTGSSPVTTGKDL